MEMNTEKRIPILNTGSVIMQKCGRKVLTVSDQEAMEYMGDLEGLLIHNDISPVTISFILFANDISSSKDFNGISTVITYFDEAELIAVYRTLHPDVLEDLGY
jgi:hypothetical protein